MKLPIAYGAVALFAGQALARVHLWCDYPGCGSSKGKKPGYECGSSDFNGANYSPSTGMWKFANGDGPGKSEVDGFKACCSVVSSGDKVGCYKIYPS